MLKVLIAVQVATVNDIAQFIKILRSEYVANVS